MKHKKENLHNESKETKEEKKKLYSSPELKSYGDVVKLTQGASGGVADSAGHMN